jgi:hypothetical protein
MRPRGQILRADIGYTGTRAREGNVLRYTVSGRGNFPTDMLRYDNARPLSPVETEGRALREVRIVAAGGCTPERWRSFGWSVHEDIEEMRKDAEEIL